MVPGVGTFARHFLRVGRVPASATGRAHRRFSFVRAWRPMPLHLQMNDRRLNGLVIEGGISSSGSWPLNVEHASRLFFRWGPFRGKQAGRLLYLAGINKASGNSLPPRPHPIVRNARRPPCLWFMSRRWGKGTEDLNVDSTPSSRSRRMAGSARVKRRGRRLASPR
jgi:hypothetical protein